jgi:hypothetical protein
MPTLNSWNNQILDANVTLNGGTCSIGTDATSGAINIGTGAAARTVTIGNNVGASSVVVDCGTGALNLGANAIARTTTLGCTTGAGVLALKYGTGDFTLASATGTIISALDTGEITYPLQPSFSARAPGVNDITGDGSHYTIVFSDEVFDLNSDFDGTSTFTAPVTGKYFLGTTISIKGLTSSHISLALLISTSNRTYNIDSSNPYAQSYISYYTNTGSVIADMDAGDIATVVFWVDGGTKVADIYGDTYCYFRGHLLC